MRSAFEESVNLARIHIKDGESDDDLFEGISDDDDDGAVYYTLSQAALRGSVSATDKGIPWDVEHSRHAEDVTSGAAATRPLLAVSTFAAKALFGAAGVVSGAAAGAYEAAAGAVGSLAGAVGNVLSWGRGEGASAHSIGGADHATSQNGDSTSVVASGASANGEGAGSSSPAGK